MRLPFDGRYLVLGVLVYIIVLVLNFPADRAYAHWKNAELSQQASRHFSLVGISGSVWSGKADLGVIQGQPLEDIHWSLRPWSLLLGQVGLNWSFRLPNSTSDQGFGRGVTNLGLDGSMDFSELEARLPVAMMANIAKMGALNPTGSVSLNLEDVVWDGKILSSATGRIVWHGAGVSLLKPLALGDLSMSLETENEQVKGNIADNGGPLSITGVVTLKADGSYQFNGSLAARNNQDLQNALRSMGRPGPDGKVKVNYSGNLARLGF